MSFLNVAYKIFAKALQLYIQPNMLMNVIDGDQTTFSPYITY